ncbi:FAD-dependent monooxygenase [Microbacterium album]|uniref:FAD-dependent oxidoreductase n=1 Tax=Microbacterium album TaxID=2053191 RepID=A0A917IFA7_9MICO|nr:FAD-dependent monooxygenase [Microbacterium album]GGH43955.1 FAD-dependent oxidoreductase [Microbacterium album]
MQSIVIVGGGIAGLTLAAALDPNRFDVTVHEQRPDLPVAGTALAMWPEALEALADIGALDALGDAPRVERFRLRAASGRTWIDAPVPGSLLVSRGDLLHALADAVPAQTKRVVGRVDAPPPAPAGAVVVGADGVHSVVRATVAPRRAAARLTPYLAVRGVLPDGVDEELHGEYWGRGALLGISPHRDGTNWYTAFRSDAGPRRIDTTQALNLARARHAGSRAAGIRAVLDAAEPPTTLAQRVWTTPPLRTFAAGRTVLIGDAAHAMTPNLGRGACESILDAVSLARLLSRLPVDDALTAYDRERRRRTRRMQRASEIMMRVALAERGAVPRDRTIALLTRLAARRATTRTPTSPRGDE